MKGVRGDRIESNVIRNTAFPPGGPLARNNFLLACNLARGQSRAGRAASVFRLAIQWTCSVTWVRPTFVGDKPPLRRVECPVHHRLQPESRTGMPVLLPQLLGLDVRYTARHFGETYNVQTTRILPRKTLAGQHDQYVVDIELSPHYAPRGGANGLVHRARSNSTGALVAVKLFSPRDKPDPTQWERPLRDFKDEIKKRKSPDTGISLLSSIGEKLPLTANCSHFP